MSCLFNTLCNFVDLDSNELRQNICNYLSENPRMFEDVRASDYVSWSDEGYNNLEDYVRNMRRTNTWGGAIEIKAFCNMYFMNVNVLDTRTNKNTINFVEGSKGKKTLDIKWNGGHYWV
jgi:hypothetical protein